MNKLKVAFIVGVIASTSFSWTALAAEETHVIPINQQTMQQFDKPGHGISMAQVENKFGAPLQRNPAVGEPPITRWVYQDFTVYFEKDIVIHAVAHRA